jgi:hypothetical protein
VRTAAAAAAAAAVDDDDADECILSQVAEKLSLRMQVCCHFIVGEVQDCACCCLRVN